MRRLGRLTVLWITVFGIFFSALTFSGCGSSGSSSSGSPVENQLPVPEITAPEGARIFESGETVTFSGFASDPEDGALTGSALEWRSSIDGPLGTGETVSTASLSQGAHVISLTATDSAGASATATITVSVDIALSVSILTPSAGATFVSGDTVTFYGRSIDWEDGSLSGAALVWSSSLDGEIGQGTIFNLSSLSVGTHEITLSATDSDGNTESVRIPIYIQPLPSENTKPVVLITEPSPAAVVTEGESVRFTGSATDAEDGVLSGSSLVWRSSRDGDIGTGTTWTTDTLSVGFHTIVLTATDSGELSAFASVDITVEAANTPPAGSIGSPAEGSEFTKGDPVEFRASILDGEDGPLSGDSMVWESDRDGMLGTGEYLEVTDLSEGAHSITLTATDSGGLTFTATFSIQINPAPENTSPTASIASPADGDVFFSGSTITLTGSAADAEDGPLSGSALTWASDLDGALGTGASLTTQNISEGYHQITFTATDSGGLTDTQTITIQIKPTPENTAPAATIVSPSDGDVFPAGSYITFSGSATDEEDGDLSGSSLAWRSSLDGYIESGSTVSTRILSVGTHTITLTATDSEGLTGSATLSITVKPNEVPEASISSPEDNAVYAPGDCIRFAGSAYDPEDGDLSGDSLVWESSINGRIGTGAVLDQICELSEGEHTITLTATDSKGLAGSASITVKVVARQAPEVVIASPADGDVFPVGSYITFSGSATDEEDGPLSGSSLAWRSSLDGYIESGSTVSTSILSVGTHTITLTATDSDGLTGSATISITVKPNEAPEASISSPGDNAAYAPGDCIRFEGGAYDPEDGELSGDSLVWESSINGRIGTGAVLDNVCDLSEGGHTITLTATDSKGLTGSASITLTVKTTDRPPLIRGIFRNMDNGVYYFHAVATDPEDGELSGESLKWESDIDGLLGYGGYVDAQLSPGAHVITLTATDSGELSASGYTTATTQVVGRYMEIELFSWEVDAGAYYLDGTALDAQGGYLSGDSLKWESDIDGLLGYGGSVVAQLSAGSHVVKFTATDAFGSSVSESVSITVPVP